MSKHMSKNPTSITRRRFVGGLAAGSALSLSSPLLMAASATAVPGTAEGAVSAAQLARDEAFWREVAASYDRTQGIINLEHGYWGKMARPVQEYYVKATKMVNAQNSFYARKGYGQDMLGAVQRVAGALGVNADEIVLTRNATEAIHNLIRQYKGLQEGDKVLFADLDYPSFKEVMGWLQASRQVSAVTLVIPPRTNQETIFRRYLDAFDANPELKLILLTHVSNQHGLVVPVARIAAEARRRGIDVICDSAQSWGLLDYSVPDLQVDWAGFNLHKWIGAPVGVGALYMQRGSLEKVTPYPGEVDPTHSLARTRVHMATANFAAMITVPAALDFHESIGAANKEARLRYLRSVWTDEAVSMSHIELLGGLDEASSTGMGAFRLAGKTTIEHAKHLQQRLENDFGIFTVVRDGLDSGGCVRITPQVFTAADELGQLVSAMKKLA
ncbi:MAG: selenocysteine lyase/cysteine desulfurase [Candidatus Azotimanducaceae bacterium]